MGYSIKCLIVKFSPSCRPEEGCDELLEKTLEKVTAVQLFDFLINNKATGKIESGHIIGMIYCTLLLTTGLLHS